MGPSDGNMRVLRGGSLINDGAQSEFCRVAFRNGREPNYSQYNLGFRLVLPTE